MKKTLIVGLWLLGLASATAQVTDKKPAPKKSESSFLSKLRKKSAPADTVVVVATPPPLDSSITKESSVLTHIVRQGETYQSIARLYDVTVGQVLYWNQLTFKKPLRTGQRLLIDTAEVLEEKSENASTAASTAPSAVAQSTTPSSVTTAQPEAEKSSAQTATTDGAEYHTVKEGETLYRIAQLYQVSAENLRTWNKLKNDSIRKGQTLKIRP
jgi:membrane-bound lytic murein transglycosylase D